MADAGTAGTDDASAARVIAVPLTATGAPTGTDERSRAEDADGSGAPSGVTTPLLGLAAIVLVGILLALVHAAASLLGPILLGAFFAAVAWPITAWARRRHWSSRNALLVTTIVVLGILMVMAAIVVLSAWVLIKDMPRYVDDIVARYPELDGLLSGFDVDQQLARFVSAERIASLLPAVAGAVSDLVTGVAIAVVLAALFIVDAERLGAVFRARTDPRWPVISRLPHVLEATATYFAVRVKVNLLTAAGLAVLLLVLGVDHALLWAVGAFFLSFVPYVGLFAAIVPPALLAFAEHGLLRVALVVAGAAILNVGAENVLEPSLSARAFRLSTWVVFLSFFFWTWILGPVGALLSMPITVLCVLILEDDPRTRWLAALLTRERESHGATAGGAAAEPVPPPPAS